VDKRDGSALEVREHGLVVTNADHFAGSFPPVQRVPHLGKVICDAFQPLYAAARNWAEPCKLAACFAGCVISAMNDDCQSEGDHKERNAKADIDPVSDHEGSDRKSRNNDEEPRQRDPAVAPSVALHNGRFGSGVAVVLE
jgi:hypothetical protein